MYTILRTDTADTCLTNIILYIAEKFGNDTALEKLDEIEQNINSLADNPYIGMDPKYMVLKRQGFKVLVLEKDLVFYKINERDKIVTIYAVTDHRQDYMKILKGM
jgi:toxin ParE1/3/4